MSNRRGAAPGLSLSPCFPSVRGNRSLFASESTLHFEALRLQTQTQVLSVTLLCFSEAKRRQKRQVLAASFHLNRGAFSQAKLLLSEDLGAA